MGIGRAALAFPICGVENIFGSSAFASGAIGIGARVSRADRADTVEETISRLANARVTVPLLVHICAPWDTLAVGSSVISENTVALSCIVVCHLVKSAVQNTSLSGFNIIALANTFAQANVGC